MGHQLGVAFGTVLSAVLGFFVADQVRSLGYQDTSAIIQLPMASLHARTQL
jgi:hypothetical protein